MKKQFMSAKGGSLPAGGHGASGGSKIIIANWKMNLSVKQSLNFIKSIFPAKNEVIIAAPYTFLCELGKHLAKKKIKLAGQNVSQFSQGAYTGEVSAKMLKEEGCAYCLVGHSERRIYYKETDSAINQKILQLLEYKIKPILCVGETAGQRLKKQTKQIITKQIKTALKGVKETQNIVVAYEPIWAISTFQKGKIKRSASLTEIAEVHVFIKKVLSALAKNSKYKIIYGGTVNPANCRDILNLPAVDGVLVGGASLKVPSFNDIIKAI